MRLTDRELRAGPECTANLFDLPTWYQYGVGPGSTGFNAWREVAAHQIVGDWVLHGACANFPLLYHWCVLPDLSPRSTATASTDIDDAVRLWGNSPAVQARLAALDESGTVIALFLESVPTRSATDHEGNSPLDRSRPKLQSPHVRHSADTGRATALDGILADIVVRYAPGATVVNDFYWKLHDGNLTAAYPANLIAAAPQGAGISAGEWTADRFAWGRSRSSP